ncbi:M48 family metalloprotease [Haloarcula hispanica]|uniref:Peptidase M48 domain-containing protein n=2 Tax=Haloarcula hispanica TaxID=51589 RepID=A0A482TII4_HALHI|nr:M48 family metalloprotease [Haloarcula hispanica]RYJ10983.1 hypothetical protein ELS20_14020 [Haloarcula hispanica]
MENTGLKLRMGLVGTALLLFYYLVVDFIAGFIQPFVGNPLIAFGTAVLLSLGLMGIQYVGSTILALDILDATELSREDAPELHDQTEQLSASMGMEKPTLYVADMGIPNAFALGRRNKGHVVLSRSLLEMLTIEETEPVIAHEMAHLYNYGAVVMAMSTVVVRLTGRITSLFVTVFVTITAFMTEFMFGMMTRGRMSAPVNWNRASMRLSALATVMPVLFITVFERLYSRYREYVADEIAVRHTGDPEPMQSALKKIGTVYTQSEAELQMDGLDTLCIFGSSESLLEQVFATHPSMDKRVDRLSRKFGTHESSTE